MLAALSLFIALLYVGSRLADWAHLPVPGALIGMVLMLVLLLLRGRIDAELRKASDAILQNLVLLFIPLIAGIIDQKQALRTEWAPLLVACVLGTGLTLWATAWTFLWMLRHEQRCARND